MPLRQDLAVTGSVNQHGEVQAIGGVNEKIEGFFDICQARGPDRRRRASLIPQSNVAHLMLRDEVVEACAAGRFAIYPVVADVDEGIELLTGRAGRRARPRRAVPRRHGQRDGSRTAWPASPRARRPFARRPRGGGGGMSNGSAEAPIFGA